MYIFDCSAVEQESRGSHRRRPPARRRHADAPGVRSPALLAMNAADGGPERVMVTYETETVGCSSCVHALSK